jgi:hypothetical protein
VHLLLIIAVVLAVLVALVVLGVGVAAGRARRRESMRTSELLGLAKVRSPSGKQFFPTDDSVLELAELLDDVDERRQRESDR